MKVANSPVVGILLAAVGSSILVAGCGKSTSSASSSTSSQFPGYQQVSQSGEAAQLWFNADDIQRKDGGYVIHALKTLPSGYARFDILTDCRDRTRRLAGTEYDRDGTAKQDYAGNDSVVAAKSEPGMSELMGAACTVMLASRAIHGDFSVPAALELLYGSYSTQEKAARWADATVPANLPWADNLSLSPGDAMSVTSVATFDFTETGKQKKLLVTNAVADKGGCHACTGLLGVATFVKDGSNWKLEAQEPYLASMGASGSVGSSFNWVTAGEDSYALVVNGGDMHQGQETASTTVFLRDTGGKFKQVIADGDTGASDQISLNVDTAFIKGKNSRHYDVKVALTYKIDGQKTYTANHMYEFVDKKNEYVLVRKDDPPKFMQPAEAPSSTLANSAALAQPSNLPVPSVGQEPCKAAVDCVNRMLTAARANDVLAATTMAVAMSTLPKPARGDRAKARRLNEEGLAALNTSNATEAVRLFTEAATADPGSEEIQSNLAYAYSLAGNFVQAVNTANIALTINPRRTSVWAPLAVTFTKMHDRPRALGAMWLAYQFSADKQKTLDFMSNRLKTETDPEVLQMYTDSVGWLAQNKMPAGL